MAPTTRNRGRPTAIRQSTPESQQTYLPTSTRANPSKRTLAAKTSSKPRLKSRTKSKSERPQQTITQMPLLHQLYHPELYHPELEYEEAQQEVDVANDPLALRSPKRRKITETPSSKGDTKRDILEPSPITTAHNVHQRSRESPAVKDMQSMPPPTTTPKRPIRKEIPSSQSPLDTPLFALSRRSSKRDTSRSPLTERSINLQTPIAITPTVSRGLGTREVADSMETEDEDQDEDEKERLHRRQDPEEFDTSRVQVKTSFQGEASIDDGVMKQAGGSPSALRSKPPTRPLEESDAVPIKPIDASSLQRRNRSSHPAYSNARIPDQISPVNEPPLESIVSSHPPHKSDIDFLAARCLPTLAVETDSQYEAGWHTYHPPRSTINPQPPLPSPTTKDNDNNQPSSSQLQYIPSSQPALVSSPPAPPSSPPSPPLLISTNNEKDKAPTQPLPSHHTPPPASLPQTPHVPASQATTTASPTQPPQFTPHRHDDDGPHILVPSSPSPIRPPTPPPGFSSPLVGWRSHERTTKDEEGERAEEHEWSPNRRVRASQLLLPASFLKDSWFVGPDDIEDGGVGMEMGEGEWIEEDE